MNKALSIDARNVEGLVARGALYANSGSFKKAVEDFENALKLNPAHANARKYMGETLVALGRSYEDENSLEAAKKAYQDCLMIIPHHEEAQTSLDFLKTKMKAPLLIEPGELQLPDINFGEAKKEDGSKRSKDKKAKKKKSGKNKKKYSSSSSSSGDSDDNDDNGSSDSSSDSSSNSSSSSGEESAWESHFTLQKGFNCDVWNRIQGGRRMNNITTHSFAVYCNIRTCCFRWSSST